jgi:hypothetical protein
MYFSKEVALMHLEAELTSFVPYEVVRENVCKVGLKSFALFLQLSFCSICLLAQPTYLFSRTSFLPLTLILRY